MMLTRSLFLICVALANAVATVDLNDNQSSARSRKLHVRRHLGEELLDDQYIVRFADSVVNLKAKVMSLLDLMDGDFEVVHSYHSVYHGIALRGNFSDEVLDFITGDDDVVSIQQDAKLQFGAEQNLAPPWGLDRIDQKNRTLDHYFEVDATGKGVQVFVIDSGVRLSHFDFGGRAKCGGDFADGTDSCDDDFGHGTHVAGIVGGSFYGVAKEAEIVAVKVCSMTSCEESNMISAMDWIVSLKKANPSSPMVINISLYGLPTPAVDDAIKLAVSLGVVVVACAGNEDMNACEFSPPSIPGVIAVGNVNRRDRRSFDSNWGSCVDLFAPGENIRSTFIRNDNDVYTMSGTSMSSPHVAGAVALYLEKEPSLTPGEVLARLLADSVTGLIRDVKESPNKMLYVGGL